MYELRVLGSLSFKDPDGRELSEVLAQPKRLALLTYLAVAGPDNLQRRDTLLALFWPELDQEHARWALNRSIYYLRRAMGDGVLVSRGKDEVGIDRERFWCDALAFQEAAENGEAESALPLYQGELLNGLHVAEALEFERWLDTERRRFQQLAAQMCRNLAEQLESDGNRKGAVDAARRAIELSPHDEETARLLLSLLNRLGDRAGALRAYEDFAGRIAEDLEAEPSPETQALVEEIRAREAARSQPTEAFPADTISADIESTRPPAAAADRRKPSRKSPARLVANLGLIAAAAGIGTLILFPSVRKALMGRGEPGAIVVGERDERPRVLVVALENQTQETSLDPIGRIAADWIRSGLAETGLVQVLSSLAPEASVTDSAGVEDSIDRASRVRAIAEGTKADVVVWGAYYRSRDSLSINTELLDPTEGSVLVAVAPTEASPEDPMPALETLRERVVGALSTLVDPKLAQWASRSNPPPNYAAYAAFVEGVTTMTVRTHGVVRLSDASRRYDEAIDHFSRATVHDSTFVQPLMWAAMAHMNRGAREEADSLLRRVARVRDDLSPLDRALLDAHSARLRRDSRAALVAWRRAISIAPQSEYHYSAGFWANVNNRPSEAIRILEATDPERGWLRSYASYWRELTSAYHMVGDHEGELDAARRAEPLMPNNLWVLAAEGRALAALGRANALDELLVELFATTGFHWISICAMTQTIVLELRAHGHLDAAEGVHAAQDAWCTGQFEAGEKTDREIYWRAGAHHIADRLEEARVLYEQLIAKPEDRCWQSSSPCTNEIGSLGYVYAALGNEGEASRIDDWLASLGATAHLALYYRAGIAGALGERERAVTFLHKSLQQGFAEIRRFHFLPLLFPLHGYPPFEALIRPKG